MQLKNLTLPCLAHFVLIRDTPKGMATKKIRSHLVKIPRKEQFSSQFNGYIAFIEPWQRQFLCSHVQFGKELDSFRLRNQTYIRFASSMDVQSNNLCCQQAVWHMDKYKCNRSEINPSNDIRLWMTLTDRCASYINCTVVAIHFELWGHALSSMDVIRQYVKVSGVTRHIKSKRWIRCFPQGSTTALSSKSPSSSHIFRLFKAQTRWMDVFGSISDHSGFNFILVFLPEWRKNSH